MWRVIVGGGMILFSLGAAAGAVLLISMLVEQEFSQAVRVTFGTAVFTWGAWACRRDWQRERQARAEARSAQERKN